MVQVDWSREQDVDFHLPLGPCGRIGSERHPSLNSGVIDNNVET